MNRKRILFLILAMSVGIAFLHIVALTFYLYWTLAWFDIMMHFLGGFLVALISFWLFFFSEYFSVSIRPTNRNIFLVILLGALLIGVGWEVFEFLFDLRIPIGYVSDTIIDIIMDTLGAFAVYRMVIYLKRNTMLELKK